MGLPVARPPSPVPCPSPGPCLREESSRQEQGQGTEVTLILAPPPHKTEKCMCLKANKCSRACEGNVDGSIRIYFPSGPAFLRNVVQSR